MCNEQLNDSRVVSENVGGPRLDLVLHSLMEVLNGKYHDSRLSIMRTYVNERGDHLRCPIIRVWSHFTMTPYLVPGLEGETERIEEWRSGG
jgi:hypothetical protein